MERYIERKKQRNQAGQMRCGMDWVFVWRCSQSSPFAFYNFTTWSTRFPYTRNWIREYYLFIASPHESLPFSLSAVLR